MGKTLNTPKAARAKDELVAVNHKAVFFVSLLDLTWQMAIVIIVPIVGGYYLDKAAGSSPAFLILGFLVAMGGFFLVVKRMIAKANGRLAPKEPHK